MLLSYWEKDIWFREVDYLIVGSGIVGLCTAIDLKTQEPKAKVLVVERGILPTGASTKNAGFACYGSPSELVDDLNHSGLDYILQTVEYRFKGFQRLLSLLGKEKMGYESLGGHEVFREEERPLLEEVKKHLHNLNRELKSIFGSDPFIFNKENYNNWGFNGIVESISLPFEGQIHTGKTIYHLEKLARELGVLCLNGLEVRSVEDVGLKAIINTNLGNISASKIAICTNGFARKLLKNEDVEPARAQVLITSEIKNLKFKGIFHMNAGYYYFRNVGNRVLIGGGRHLFRQNEHTYRMQTTAQVQKHLEKILKKYILTNQPFTVDDSWAGIMGFGSLNEKGSLVKQISRNIVCGVRLGGMGIAIGAEIGQKTSKLLLET